MRSRSSAIARRSWRTRSCWRSRPSRSRRICPRGRGSRARSSASSCDTSSESTRRSAAAFSRINFSSYFRYLLYNLHSLISDMTSFISTASCSRGARVRARWSSSRSTWTEPRQIAWTSSPMIQRRWGTVTIYHPTFKTLIFMHFWILNQQLHTSFPSYQTTETEIWNVMSINLCRRFCIPSRVIIKLSSNLGWPSPSCHVVKHKVCSKAINEPSQCFTVAGPSLCLKRKGKGK